MTLSGTRALVAPKFTADKAQPDPKGVTPDLRSATDTFDPLEVVSRSHDPQPRVGENWQSLKQRSGLLRT